MSLVAWGETHIDSNVAAIAQASVPIFGGVALASGQRILGPRVREEPA